MDVPDDLSDLETAKPVNELADELCYLAEATNALYEALDVPNKEMYVSEWFSWHLMRVAGSHDEE